MATTPDESVSLAQLALDFAGELMEEMSWIETELRVMQPFFQSIERWGQLSENEPALLDQTREVILKTEDAIVTNIKEQIQRLRWLTFPTVKRILIDASLKKKLQPFKRQLIQVRKGWRMVDFTANSQHHSGSAAMDTLDSAMNVSNLNRHVLECIKWVRGELAPLQNFLEEIDRVEVLGGRQEIWVEELRGIFQFINESFTLGGGGRKVVSEIQDKILQLYRRYYAYGLGEIQVNNGSGPILPRIRMTTPIPAVSIPDIFTAKLESWIMQNSSPFIQPSLRTMTYLSFLTPGASIESLGADLNLMKALLKETGSREDLDERANVWLKQLREIVDDLQALLNEHASNVSGGGNGVFHQLFGQRRIDSKLKQIAREICDLTSRKMTYSIGSALGEAGMLNSIAAILLEYQPRQIPVDLPALEDFLLNLDEQVISKTELRRRLEPVRKELLLMDALFKDVSGMAKLDARLKIWVEEMRVVAGEAEAVVASEYKNFCARKQAARRIKQVYHHIFMISKWKHTYGVGDVKSSRTRSFNHSLEKAAPYPSNSIELFRREIKFIQTLYGDIEKKDKLDGHTKAWIEEMHNLTTYATGWISRNTEHTHGSSATSNLHQNKMTTDQCFHLARMKDKINQLSEIKIAYGIGTREVTPGSDAFDINSVPSYLRQCLYYFLLFPANFEVPTRRLIVLWAAAGLVRKLRESDEDVANCYLNELMQQNIVHGKTKKLNGKYKTCQLNEDIRDTLSMRAKESRFFQDTPEKLSRLVDQHGTSDSCFIRIHGNPIASSLLKNYRSVLSFMSFNTREGNKPGEDIGNFLDKCISAGCFLELRVLDLEKVFRPKLSEAICNLKCLRYLGLRWTYLEHLPKFVHKLLSLQVLDVKHTYISVLPNSIWRMQYLRHLYLSETYRTKFIGHPSEVSLHELQTLWGAFIDEDTYVRNGLGTALYIRKLGLSCRPSSSSSEPFLMSKQLKAVNDWISGLRYLEVLRLKSRDEHGKASELHLKSLRNESLSTVYLLGKLDPAVVYEFPVNLIDITLSGSELKEDPMIFLERLCQLRILRLLSLSVKCTSICCSGGGFPQLIVLKIWKLENLEDWMVEEGALRSLEDLEIRSCEKLKVLPDLQHVSTLRKCMLTSMSGEFIKQTKFRQPALWPKIEVYPNAVQEQF